MFRKILALKLRFLTSAILWRHKPKVIAITGSVGKSSTKEAVFHILSSKFSVRKSENNFNTEIGVPLTIIGSDTGGRDVFKWIGIFIKGHAALFGKFYPKILVLEMGADRSGELYRLTSFIKPDISVVTSVGISHLEFFKTREAIKHEKAALVKALAANGTAILNADDAGAYSLRSETKGQVLTYGFSESADVKAVDACIKEGAGQTISTAFEVLCQNQKHTVNLERSLGEPMVYAVLAGLSTAFVLGMDLAEAAKAASDFYGLPGRLQVFAGINGATIIDDSYNSAPVSAIAALNLLKNYPGKRKIAVMGKMAELGEESETGHRQVGVEVANLNVDLLLVKDNEAAWIADEAVKVGFDAGKIRKFSESIEAVDKLQRTLQPGDVVLLKASQSEYFEDIIKEIMAEPEKQKELLIQRDYTR